MSRVIDNLPQVALFLAGVAVATVVLPRRQEAGLDAAGTRELKRSLADLEARLQTRDAAVESRLAQVDTRLDEHEMRLKDVPSTTQIVAAMEQLLVKTMPVVLPR